MANDVKLRAVITAQDKSGAVLQGFGSSVSRVSEGAERSIRRLALAFSAATVAAAAFSVKSASEVEDSRIAFETMLGSADKAEKMLQELSDFAVKTPFTLPTIREGAKQILAYGVSAEEILPTIKALGDISAGVGRDKLPFLVLALGQVRAAGRLMGTELRQFTEAGVPLLEALSKKLGKTTAQIRDDMERGAGPSFKVVQETIFDMTEEGGKFFNLMQRQSKTFGGVMSNIQDQLGRVSREIIGIDEKGNIKDGGIFFKLKGGAQDFLDYLNTHSADISRFFNNAFGAIERLSQKIGDLARQVGNYLGPKLQALWNTISGQLLPVLTRLWKEVIAPLAPVVGAVLVGAFGLLIDTLNLLLPILTGLTNWLIDNKTFVLAIATAVGVLWATMKAKSAIDAFIGNFNAAKTSAIKAIATIRGAQGLGGLNSALAGFTGWGIFAAAGIAAFVAIQQKAAETRKVLDDTDKAVEKATESKIAAIKQLGELKRTGTPEQKKRATEALRRIQGFASGTNYFQGGTALIGERGPELVNLPRGSSITPSPQTKQIIKNGQPTVNITIQAGAFMGSQQDARKYAMMIMSAYRDAMGARGMA